MADNVDQQAGTALARAVHFAYGEPIPHPLLRTTLNPDKTNDEANLSANKGFNWLVKLSLLAVLQQADVLLQHNAKNCTAYDTQALALYGIAHYTNRDNAAHVRAAYDDTRPSSQDIGTVRRIQGLFKVLGEESEVAKGTGAMNSFSSF